MINYHLTANNVVNAFADFWIEYGHQIANHDDIRQAVANYLVDTGQMSCIEGLMEIIENDDGSVDVNVYENERIN